MVDGMKQQNDSKSLNGWAALVCFVACVVMGYRLLDGALPVAFWTYVAGLFLLTVGNFYVWGMWQQELSLKDAAKRDRR